MLAEFLAALTIGAFWLVFVGGIVFADGTKWVGALLGLIGAGWLLGFIVLILRSR